MNSDIREFKTIDCICERCVKMCEESPCQGTPEEMKAIIDAGFGGRLMRQYRENSAVSPAIPHTAYLAPAIVGREGDVTPFFPFGRCTFLTEQGRCELHALGLKPLEGRVVTHLEEGAQEKEDDALFPILAGYEIRDYIATLWMGKKAQKMVEEWEEEHLP